LCCGGAARTELACLQQQSGSRRFVEASMMRSVRKMRLPYGEARYNPGLMDGLCGVGYTALRCAAASHIPSVAMFSTRELTRETA
jgi:lantibiotic modifying enzyme